MPSDCSSAGGFRNYFTPLTGVLFTFPSRYWFTIGRHTYSRLGEWAPQLPTGFHGTRGTRHIRVTGHIDAYWLRGSHPLCPAVPGPFASADVFACSQRQRSRRRQISDGHNPGSEHRSARPLSSARFGHATPFARHYSGTSFLFLGVLRCFSSPGSPPAPVSRPAPKG
jgi:hypothetical protein